MKPCPDCGSTACPKSVAWTTHDQVIAAAQVCALVQIARALIWIAKESRR